MGWVDGCLCLPMQVNCVVRHGCIGPMCALLICQDATVIQVILDGLGNILKMAGPDARMIADAIDEAGGLDKIENLQTHENVDIYKLAYAIIDKYFPDEVSSSRVTVCGFTRSLGASPP